MPLPKTQARLPKVLSRDQVYQHLRRWLVEGSLEPGERLNYYDIGKQLGFSAIPIREACLRLHYEGFVEMAHSRWTRVVSLSIRQALEICQAIEVLEVRALELAFPLLQASDVRRLRVLNQDLRGALESGEIKEAVVADRAFHAVWVDRSANRKVAELLTDLKDHLQIAERQFFGPATVPVTHSDIHDMTVEALAQSDASAASRTLREHWRTHVVRLQMLSEAESIST